VPPAQVREDDPREVLRAVIGEGRNNPDKRDYPPDSRQGLPSARAPVQSVLKQGNQRVQGTEKFWRRGGREAVRHGRAAPLSAAGRAGGQDALCRANYQVLQRKEESVSASRRKPKGGRIMAKRVPSEQQLKEIRELAAEWGKSSSAASALRGPAPSTSLPWSKSPPRLRLA
jgi:hypothetical protein